MSAPAVLARSAACFTCIPSGSLSVIDLTLLKQWSGGSNPLSPVIVGDGAGGFWLLIVDTLGNVGTRASAGPATSNVILSDGSGGFWQIIVNSGGLRGTQASAGPATVVPVLTDGSGGHWQLVVDTQGNLGAQSAP